MSGLNVWYMNIGEVYLHRQRKDMASEFVLLPICSPNSELSFLCSHHIIIPSQFFSPVYAFVTVSYEKNPQFSRGIHPRG